MSVLPACTSRLFCTPLRLEGGFGQAGDPAGLPYCAQLLSFWHSLLKAALSTLWRCADKASFTRPLGLYGSYGLAARKAFRENGNANRVSSEMPLPEEHRKIGMTPICPRAGDMMIMPEAMTHGVMPWIPTDRPRYVLGLRYQSQHLGGSQTWPDGILEKLSPNTRELLQHAHYAYTKGIARQRSVDVRVDVVNRSDDDAAGLLPPGARL